MISKILQDNLFPIEDFIYGTADLRGLINKKFSDHQFGISIGKRLDDKIIDAIKNGPTLEYFEHYQLTNSQLLEIAEKIKNELQKNNISSLIIKPTTLITEKEFKGNFNTLTYEVSHKMIATRAGLGWIGKTALFISNEFGPRLRLVSILINKNPGTESIPINYSKCGECNICVEKCPAKAANGKLWNINIHRDEFFDSHKCRDKCGELAKQKLNTDIKICGLCVAVCPIGKRRRIEIKP
ncbi:MAG: epoxyqueuosine reductase [Bacteroidales bacterium]|nr:epoxyqueuosine reductase [Bacteroidales bacterium]